MGHLTVIVAEELPAPSAASAYRYVQAAAGVGGIVGSAIFPIVAKVSLGWRAMYLIGIVPLVIVFFIRRSVRETQALCAARAAQVDKPEWTEILDTKYRTEAHGHRLPLALHVPRATRPSSPSGRPSRSATGGSTVGQVSLIVAISYTIGLSGFIAAGKLMDDWGRRPTCVLFFGVGAVATFAAFNAPPAPLLMGASLVVLIFFATSYLTLCSTYTAELFPTRLRASAAAWTNNTLGRVGMVLAPTMVGLSRASSRGRATPPAPLERRRARGRPHGPLSPPLRPHRHFLPAGDQEPELEEISRYSQRRSLNARP